MLPAIPPLMLQPPMAAAPFMLPNAQAQQPIMPFQPMAMPFMAPPNQILSPQQQALGGLNPMGNGQLPQGDMPVGPVPRFRRTLLRRMQDKSTNENAQVTPTPSVTSSLYV
ncbi:secretory calcium-binding phosphoprotein 9 [Hoplias malabaricus]|uniref:secretory calcium-binding phosphoprotein 9 n=1 Tax=Hoplias malabaricus TaxID=27720 RepID=UPI003462796F